jgi:hypothetical protein
VGAVHGYCAVGWVGGVACERHAEQGSATTGDNVLNTPLKGGCHELLFGASALWHQAMKNPIPQTTDAQPSEGVERKSCF